MTQKSLFFLPYKNKTKDELLYEMVYQKELHSFSKASQKF